MGFRFNIKRSLGAGLIPGGGGAPAVTTWDPAFKPAAVTLSTDKLTATGDGASGDNLIRGTTSAASGKRYFECRMGGAGYIIVGVTNSSGVVTAFPGSTVNGIGFGFSNFVYDKGSSSNYGLGGIVQGDVIGVAVDLDARMLWFAINGNFGTRAPAAGTGGLTLPTGAAYPACDTPGPTSICTGNFGQSAFAFAPPSGFTAWG